MQFTMRKELPYSKEAVWKLISDPEFSKASYALADATFNVLENTTEGNKQTLKAEITFKQTLPAVAAKLLGTDQLIYDQTLELFHDEQYSKWTIAVRGAGSKVQIYGKWGVEAHEDGSLRFFEGNVHVNIMFIGRKVEKEISKKLEMAQKAIVQLICDKLG